MAAARETDAAAPAPERTGEIGRWRIVRLIGRGGMAEVYEVEDPRLGARYALKLFTYARGDEDAARERFFAEGRLLARLAHPRLVRVYDMDEDAATGRPYFVMDLILGPAGEPRTLADAGAAGADEAQVADWYEDLREGLAYIHARGILHRDLKLQNVLVGPDGHAVISDFGVAKIFNPALREDLGLTPEQTLMAVRDGRRTVMGSVGYLAPEMEMGVSASKESDWYALGVIIFRLLTGVWCDARTDVAADLETYDPVWLEILPRLLHANPAGRACPSWKDLARARREEEAYRAEKAYADARDKLRRAKKAKKGLVALAAVFLAVGGAAGAGAVAWHRLFHLPPFDALCAVPADAPRETDDDAPTAVDYELAQIDAWVLTHHLLDDVGRCKLTRAAAATAVRALARRAAAEDDAIFAGDYTPAGDLDVLAVMLTGMADRMERRK